MACVRRQSELSRSQELLQHARSQKVIQTNVKLLGLEGDPDLQFLLQGGDLLKVLSPSWKKTRFLQLQEDCKTMYRKSKKPFKSHQTFPIDDISSVRKGRQSEGLKKYTEEQIEGRCFSIVFKSHRKNLDLIASSEEEAKQWVRGLEKLMSNVNNLSRQQTREQYPASEVLQDAVNFFFLTESLKERQQVQQLRVIHVVKPRLDWDSIFWMENVGGRRIVHNDDVVELSSQPAEVFDVVPSVKDAGLPEEPCSENPPLVQEVCYGVCILGETGCEEHTLKQLPHLLKEFIHVRPFQHINLMNGTIYLHRNDEIRIADGLKGAVNKCFIQVNNHALFTVISYRGLRQEVFGWRLRGGSVLFNRRGHGACVSDWGLHIVVAKATQECAEYTPAPLLLQAVV